MGIDEQRMVGVVGTLRADAATVEAHQALSDRGLDMLLLKGPTIGEWLYPAGEERHYGDTDLLVRESQRGEVEQVLGDLGYVRRPGVQPTAPLGVDHHAEPWDRPRDGSVIDLHRTLMGVTGSPEHLFAVLYARRVPFRVGSRELFALDIPGRALYVVLHAGQHADTDGRPQRDLELALETLPISTWRQAADLAREIGAEAALAATLHTEPAGQAVAAALDLPHDLPGIALMRAEGRRGVHTLWRAEAAGSSGEKVRLILREVFISPSEIRRRTGIGPTRHELAHAYVARLVHAVPTTLRYWRLRRTRRRS